MGYIITGTTRGIGRAFADLITERKHPLFALNRRPDDRVDSNRNFSCDLGQADQVSGIFHSLMVAVREAGCRELVLINNAAVLEPVLPIEKIFDDQIQTHLQTNLAAPFQLISAFIRQPSEHLVSRRIINITSGAAEHAYAGWSLYCATKAGLNMLTRCVDLEQKQRESPVSICAVAPGVVDTDMQQMIRQANPEDFPLQKQFVQFQVKGQLSDPKQVAQRILDLDLDGALQSGGVYDLRTLEG